MHSRVASPSTSAAEEPPRRQPPAASRLEFPAITRSPARTPSNTGANGTSPSGACWAATGPAPTIGDGEDAGGTEEHELCEPTPGAQPSLSPHALTLGVEPTLTNLGERTPPRDENQASVIVESAPRPRRRHRRGRSGPPSDDPAARALSNGHAGTDAGPVVDPDEDHRSHRRLVGVVVLAGVLEDLLHRAGGAGEEHDAAVAAPHERRLAHRVLEVLGDRRGEHVGRLVTVEPGRDAEPPVATGPPAAHLERHPGPRRRPTGRYVGTAASTSMASSSAPSSCPASAAPRLTASIAPGPPPVPTSTPGPGQGPAQPGRPRGSRRRPWSGRGRP